MKKGGEKEAGADAIAMARTIMKKSWTFFDLLSIS